MKTFLSKPAVFFLAAVVVLALAGVVLCAVAGQPFYTSRFPVLTPF